QCATSHKAQMVTLEKPPLVGGQSECFTSRIKVGDPPEQPFVERDSSLMLGELWRVVAGDRFKRVIGIARIEIEEHPAHPVEQTAATLERLDRIGKGRRRGRTGDRGNLGIVLGHRSVKGRWKVFGPNAVERR